MDLRAQRFAQAVLEPYTLPRTNDGLGRPWRAGRRWHGASVELCRGGASGHVTKLAKDGLDFLGARDRRGMIVGRELRVAKLDPLGLCCREAGLSSSSDHAPFFLGNSGI